MKPGMDPKFQPLILTTLISVISILIPSCFCQNNPQYETCNQPFQCGSLGEIRFPFWGGNRPPFCGYPGFELSCRGDIPILNISSTSYRVLDVDNNAQILRVARNDLWDNLCSPSPVNTTLNFTLFDYYSTANDRNISLFYGCGQAPQVLRPNQFSCAVNRINTLGFYVPMEAAGLANSIMCNTNIYVPVNRTAAEALASFAANTSINLLQSSLRSGFSIGWRADDEGCEDCVRSGGLCGRDQETGSFACHCSDGTRNGTCNGSNDLKKHIIIGVSLGVGGIVISSIIIFYIRKQCMLRKSNQNGDKFILNHGSLALKRYNYSQVKNITKSFSDKLGQGGFGIVYKGKLSDGQLVAVKVLTETNDSGEEFINEVASISRTSHVNIVNLLGFCYERKKRALIYEFMPNKSLDKFIYTSNVSDSHLEWEKLYEIAIGVARGLEYLHRGCNTRIVHFDIKPQNILLDEDFCPKIADFGLAKLAKEKQSMISMLGTRGTIGYIAPEVFSRNFGGVSHKSDVYSYGMMLLEMAGARKVAEIEATQSSEDYFPDQIYEHVLLNNEKLDDELMSEEKEEISRKMLLVGLWCIQTAPSDRPSMTKVVEMLEGSPQSIGIPPKPSLFCSKLSGKQTSSSISVSVEIESSIQV